jgi:glycosyltransferase involved in cell wall biosynthesis
MPQRVKTKIRKKYTGGCEYFLFVGALHPRKNVSGLLKAFEDFKSETDNDIKLVIVGGEMHKTGDIFETFENMRFKNDVVFTRRVTTDDLHDIVGAALALTFVPFFEGFGIPVLEAFACGCPVLLSNGGSLPEIGGDAALYFTPTNEESLLSEANKLLNDKLLRKQLVDKANNRLHKFSWDKSYHDHLKIYESIK